LAHDSLQSADEVQQESRAMAGSVRENVCNISEKRKKSCFFDFPKKTFKNVKKHRLTT